MKQKWSVINRKPNYKVETKILTSKNFEWQRDSTGIKSSDLRKKKEKRRQFRKQNSFHGNNNLNSGSTILFENGRVVSSKRKREFSGSSYEYTQNHSPSHCFDSDLTCHQQYFSSQQKASKKSKFSETEPFSTELKRHRLTIPSIDIYKREKGDLVSQILGDNRVCSDSEDEFTSDFTYNREIDDLYFDTQPSCHSNKIRAKVEADFERQFRNNGIVTKQVNQSTERLLGSGVGGASRGVTCASSASYVLQSPRIVQLKSDVRKYNKKSVSSVKGINVSKFESLSISVDLNNTSTGRQISDNQENMNRKSRKRLRQISGSSYNRRDTSSDSDSSITSSGSSFSSASSGIRKKARHKSERSDESSDCRSTCSENSSTSSRASSSYSRNRNSHFTSNRYGKSIVRSHDKSSGFRGNSSSCISSRDNDKYLDSYSSDSSSSSYMSRSSRMENNRNGNSIQTKTLLTKEKIGISSDIKTATADCVKQTDHQKRKLSKRRKSSASENRRSAMKTEHEGSDSTDENSSGSNLSQYKLHPKRRKSSNSGHTRSANKMEHESSDSCHSDISESRLSQYKLHSSSSSSSQSSSSSPSSSSSSDIDSETKDVTNLLNRINDYHKSLSGYKCLLDKTDNKQESDSKLPNIVASNGSRQISSCAKENVVCDVNRIKKVEVNKENKQVDEDQSVKWCNEFLDRYKCLAKNTDDAHEKFEFSQDAKLSKTDEAAEVENCTETKSAEMTKDEAVSSAPVSQKSQFGNTYSYFVQGSSDSDTDYSDYTDSDVYKDDVTEPSTTAVGTGSSYNVTEPSTTAVGTGSLSLSRYLFSGQTKQTAADIESCDKDGNVENTCNDEKPTEVTSNEYHTDTETDVEDELPLRNVPRLRLDIENTALPVFTSVLSRSNPKDTCVPATTSVLSESNPEDVSAAISTQKPSTCIPILYRQKLCGYSSSENELDDNKTDTESQVEVEINTFEEENSNTGNLKENKAFETIASLPETKEDSCVNRNMLKDNNGSVKNVKEKPRIYDFYVYSETDSEDEQLPSEVQQDCSSNEKQQELITTINTDSRNSDPLEVKSKTPNSSLEEQDKTTDNTLEVKDKTLDDPLEIELKKFYLLLQSEQNLDNVRNSDSRNSKGVEKLVTKVKTDITSNEAEEFSTKVKLDDGTSNDGELVTNDKTDNTSYKEENPVTSNHNTMITERPKHEIFTRLKEKTPSDPLVVKGKAPNCLLEVQGRTANNTLEVKDKSPNTQLDLQSRSTNIAFEVKAKMPNNPLEVKGKNTDNMSEVKDKSSNTSLDVQSRPADIAFEMKSKMPNSPLEVQSRTTDNTLEVKDKTLDDPLETEIKKFYLLLHSEQNLDSIQILDNNVEHTDQSEKHVYLNPEHVDHDTTQVENNSVLDTKHGACNKQVEQVKFDVKYVEQEVKHLESHNRFVNLNTPHFTCNIRNSSLEVQGRNTDNTLELKCKTVDGSLEGKGKTLDNPLEGKGKTSDNPLDGKGKTSDNPLEIEIKKFHLMLQFDQNLDNIKILEDNVKTSDQGEKCVYLSPEQVDHETTQVENRMDTKHMTCDKHEEQVELDTKPVEQDIKHLEPDTKYINLNAPCFTCNIRNSLLEVQGRNTDNTLELKCKTADSSLEGKSKTLDDPLEIELKKFYLLLQSEQNLDHVKPSDQSEKRVYLGPRHVDHDTKQGENNMNTEHEPCSSVSEICSQKNSETENLNMEKQMTIKTQKEYCYLKTESTSRRDFGAKHLNIQKCLNVNNDFIEEYESYGSETETYSQTTEDYLLAETKTVHLENTPTDKIDLHVKPIVQGQSSDLPVNPVVKGQGSDVHVKPIVKGQSSEVKTGCGNISAAYLRVKPLNKSPGSDLKCRAWLNNRKEPCVTSEMIDNSQGEDLREVIKRARKASFDMNQNEAAYTKNSDCYTSNFKMGPSINNSDSRNVLTYEGSDYGDQNVFTCSSSNYGKQNVSGSSSSEFSQVSKSCESNNVGSLYHEYESVEKNYDSDDTIPVTYPSYGIQSLCSDVNSSKICSQSLSKNRTQREYSDQQKNYEIHVDKYHEVSKTQNTKISVCQEAVSLKHSSDIGNCPDLGSSGYRDKIRSVSYSQGVAVDTSCKKGPIHHAVTEQPVYSKDLDQNKNEKVSYSTDVSSEECAAEEIIKSSLEKREYEELHLSSEESIALSENKIDTSSLSPELMEIILKKRTELEKNFTKDCQVFVSVCEFLLSKDPGLTEQLQTCMQKCLEDISENFAEAFQNFVQTTVDENGTKH